MSPKAAIRTKAVAVEKAFCKDGGRGLKVQTEKEATVTK